MSLPAATTYRELLARVKETLLEGQQRIEQERVMIYWKTGQVVNAHILKNKGRADYGAEVIKRLAEDLNIDKTILNRCRKFAGVYPRSPIGATWHQFRWSHYRELITVSDDNKRRTIEKAALKNAWSVKELAARIKLETPPPKETASSPTRRFSAPRPGKLYTYTTLTPPSAFTTPGTVLADCGFEVSRQVKPKDWPRAVFKSKMEYTYRAWVEKVIDGDTLWAQIDLGLKAYTRQKLRLRGIDCPEASTAAGQNAKAFVEKQLKGKGLITVMTSKSDKYDRYLADVWYGKGDLYLNQQVVDEGLAGVWG